MRRGRCWKWILVVVFGFSVVLFAILFLMQNSEKISKVVFKNYGRQIEFELNASNEIKFKSPVGADVRVSVASADTVVPVSVTQEGQDTLVRLRAIAKKSS